MRRLALLPLLMFAVACNDGQPLAPDNLAPQLSQAPGHSQDVCMVDDFDFLWDMEKVQAMGPTAALEGVLIDPPDVDWIVSGMISPPAIFGRNVATEITLRADNPNADGCQLGSSVDYFVYTGSREVPGVTFSGTFDSYCNDVVEFSGTWSGTFYHKSCANLPNSNNAIALSAEASPKLVR